MEKDNLKGESKITSEHIRNNKDIRGLLSKRGIKPEDVLDPNLLKAVGYEVRIEAKNKEVQS